MHLAGLKLLQLTLKPRSNFDPILNEAVAFTMVRLFCSTLPFGFFAIDFTADAFLGKSLSSFPTRL
jgi:hypothetical protein